MEYEQALALVGGCGRYQIIVFILLGMITMKSAYDFQFLLFSTYMPPYTCVQPFNSTNDTKTLCFQGNKSCTAWQYDKSTVKRTMMTEFNLTCGQEFTGNLFMTLAMVAITFGRMIGLLSDKFGRRKMILILVGYDLILTPIQAFVPTLKGQFAMKMIRGLGDGVILTALFFLMEIVSIKYRANVGCNYWICYCIGYAGTALIGTLLRDWRYIQAVSTLVFPAYIALCFLLVESPRWLLVKGDRKQAIKSLVRIARINGKRGVTTDRLENVRADEDVSPGRFSDCFSSRRMAMKTIIMAIIMWTSSFVYFGVALDATFASQNIYVNIALMGLIEIPASPLSWVLADKVGRKIPAITLFCLSGVIILIVPHLPLIGPAFWVRTMIAVIGKFILNTAYCLETVHISELQPTCVRNVSLLPTVIVMNLGGILSPMVLHLFTINNWLPSVIFGVSCFIGALSLIPLPETRDMPLAQTVEEADLLAWGREGEFKTRLEELRARKAGGLLKDNEIEMPQNIIA